MPALVIVESPTKAKTIRDFLPKGYEVVASMGHIRDLPQSAAEIPEKVKKEPWAQLGINVDQDFEPLYVVPKDKKKILKEIKDKLKNADELILATDEDREGESISWHLLQELKPKQEIPVKRMVFHEITKEAITKALKETREIKLPLVRAQETRRLLDRLVGYTLSPLLWKKVAAGLSAGRVQSVSIRLLVMKERERRSFRKGSYWDIQGLFTKDQIDFEAKLVQHKGQTLATGQDFDESTGQLKKGKKLLLMGEKEAREIANNLSSASFSVISVEEKPNIKRPAPPFITSTLQQEANRKLKLSPRQTMQVAQALYEKGFITYMRTDSVNLSEQALQAARQCVVSMYGKDYLTEKPRVFETKSAGAQEAHEAIRPAGSSFPVPNKTNLDGRELALYDLIWKRTVATQMQDAKQLHISMQLQAGDSQFRASGKRILFPGFFRAYVEGSDDPTQALEDKEILLPELKTGDQVKAKTLDPKAHETKPPARYSEASLVKKLETEGIGRPSTYATILDTIVNRGYVKIINHTLVPSFTAFAVVNLLERHFPDLVDTGFTASMEQVLDEIAQNQTDWLPYMKQFYLGETGLQNKASKKTEEIDAGEFRHLRFEDISAQVCIGRFGPYIEVEENGERITASIPQDTNPADLDQNMVDLIILQKKKGNDELGIHPCGLPVFLLNGAFGPYVQLGEAEEGGPKPKRVSLPKGMKEGDVNIDVAVGLLSLPRTLGIHEEGGPIKAGISRFGSYIVWERLDGEKDYRTLPKDESVIDVDLERALDLLNQEKKRGRRTKEAERELGPHPEDQKPVQIFKGPYGPYIKHGTTNVSIPKDQDLEKVTLAMALDMLGSKQKEPAKKGRKKKGE